MQLPPSVAHATSSSGGNSEQRATCNNNSNADTCHASMSKACAWQFNCHTPAAFGQLLPHETRRETRDATLQVATRGSNSSSNSINDANWRTLECSSAVSKGWQQRGNWGGYRLELGININRFWETGDVGTREAATATTVTTASTATATATSWYIVINNAPMTTCLWPGIL